MNFLDSITGDTRFFPSLVAASMFLVTLFCFDKLTEPLQNWLVPSLLVYVIGTSFIGYLQTMLLIRMRGQLLACWQFFIIICLHVALFASFIAYNFFRGVL